MQDFSLRKVWHGQTISVQASSQHGKMKEIYRKVSVAIEFILGNRSYPLIGLENNLKNNMYWESLFFRK